MKDSKGLKVSRLHESDAPVLHPSWRWSEKERSLPNPSAAAIRESITKMWEVIGD